jgi:hypothetical protein
MKIGNEGRALAGKEIRGRLGSNLPLFALMAEKYPSDTPLLRRLGGGELLLAPPYLRMSQLPNVLVCLLTPLRNILSAARGVLWKPKRNSMKNLCGISLRDFFAGFYQSVAGD